MVESWFRVEPNPTERQKQRVDQFLQELLQLTLKSGISIRISNDLGVCLFDHDRGSVVGLGLHLWASDKDPSKLIAYTAEDSVLDEAWSN